MQRSVLAVLCLVLIGAIARSAPTQQSHVEQVQAGQQLFQGYCSGCHAISPGSTIVGPSLAGELKGGSPAKLARVRATILNGKGKMPAQRSHLSDKDLANLLAYLKTL